MPIQEDGVLLVEVDGRVFRDFDAAMDARSEQIEDALTNAAGPLKREINDALQRVAQEMKRRHSDPWSVSSAFSSSRTLHSRTGGGLQAIRDSIQVMGGSDIESLSGRISAPFPMNVHETGATIRPRSSEYLTIPLPPALSNQGVPLRPSARAWPRTFVTKSRSGNLLVFQRNGKDITPLYALKKSVTIPPRLGMQEYINNDVLPWFERRAFEIISDQIDSKLGVRAT